MSRMDSIATIISYCTNDFRFIGKCIAEAKVFSKQIIVPVCDHFFDGTLENRQLLEYTYAQHPDCQFIEFAYLPDRLYSRYHECSPDSPNWAIYWASTTRCVGLPYVDPSMDYILFLDSDEIVEGDQFLAWFRSEKPFDAQRLAAYFYALRPTLRAKEILQAPLLVKKNTLAPLTLLNGFERAGVYAAHPGPKRWKVVRSNGLPFVHHYSWVRTKEECLRKTRTWGHRNDEDWEALIERAFSGDTRELFGTTHEFEEIPSAYFDPLKTNVLKINDSDLFRKEIESAVRM